MPIDPDTLEALFRTEAYPLETQLAAKFASHAELAGDAVQHAFLRLRMQEPVPDRPIAWLSLVAQNFLRDRIRASKRLVDEEAMAPGDTPSVGPPTLTTTTTRSLHIRTIQEALDDLSEKDKSLLKAKYLDGVDYVVVAQELGIAKGSVGTMLHRARARLRALVEERLRSRPR